MSLSVKKSVLLTLFLYMVFESFALAQVDTAWVRRYNGSGNGIDNANALAVDSSGNVYVTGYSVGVGTSGDFVTIKYLPNGDTAWVRRYDGPGNNLDKANALAVDGSGNVYVTGYSVGVGTSGDFATIKYLPNGETAWVGRYNGPLNENANALVVDDSGNVYVTGSSVAVNGNPDYATIKYYPNGDTAWIRRYNGPLNDGDSAIALAVDSLGNVYVTGTGAGSSGSYDYATIKYSSAGDALWVRRYNGPGNSDVYLGADDYANALAIDTSGNVYVTGSSSGSGTSYDYATIKYSSAGDTLWVRRYNGLGNGSDEAKAIAVDGSGNLYVTGYGSEPFLNYTTIKYAPNGDTLWVRRYNGLGNGQDVATALAVDGSGNVYVTGKSSSDYATIKYTPNGDSLWVRRYHGPGSGGGANALAVDASGNVYVTGFSGSESSLDYATIKYSPCSAKPGDASANNALGLNDVIADVNYVFNKPGFPPCVSNNKICWLNDLLCRGNWNGDASVNLADAIRGVNYMFSKPGGPWNPLPSGVCCVPVP